MLGSSAQQAGAARQASVTAHHPEYILTKKNSEYRKATTTANSHPPYIDARVVAAIVDTAKRRTATHQKSANGNEMSEG